MFKNFHIKIFAVCAAIVFWLFAVSIENSFYRFPGEISIQVFNQAQELALASQLGTVKLTIRAQDPNLFKTLSANDFEAYIDLRNIGVGVRRVPVSVSSRNPAVSVLSAAPSEIEITLEPVREKTITLISEVVGNPADGFRVQEIRLSKSQITVSGADSLLRRISQAKAQISLDGRERQNIAREATVILYDRAGSVLEGVNVDDRNIEASVVIAEVETSRQIGIKPKITGSVSNGAVKKIEVEPAVISVVGLRDALENLDYIETESVDLKDATETIFEKTVKVVLPVGISLASGENNEVKIKVEIER